MKSKMVQAGCVCVLSLLGFAAPGFSETAPPAPAAPASPQPKLVWDAETKELTPAKGALTADFVFSVTNVSESEVVIDQLHPSCGCTTAKLPSQPWHIAPHTGGQINVSVDLRGKFGVLFKTIDVISTNAPKRLSVRVNLSESPMVARTSNQEKAKADRQAVFKGECAKCHVEPTRAKTGKELYVAACGICHDANPRATMVPNLQALNHSTDANFWKVWISTGKPGTLMPGFATREGGPLSDEQIDSLVQVMVTSFPSAPQNNAPKAALFIPGSRGEAKARTSPPLN